MLKINSDLLFKHYPSVFDNHRHIHSQLHYGIVCGDGWYGIIDELASRLEAIAKQRLQDGHNDFLSIYAISARKGELIVSVKPRELVTVSIDKMLINYKCMSSSICEICGYKAKPRDVLGEIQTICSNCL